MASGLVWDVTGKGGAGSTKDCRTHKRSDLMLGDRLLVLCVRFRNFSLEWKNSAVIFFSRDSVVQPVSYSMSTGVKQPGREAYRSLSTDEVDKDWSYSVILADAFLA